MDHFTINRVLPIKTILSHFRNYLNIAITNKIITIMNNPLIITTDMVTVINFHLQKNYDITLPSIINNYNWLLICIELFIILLLLVLLLLLILNILLSLFSLVIRISIEEILCFIQ